jgi:hypothetical protein
MRSTDFLNYAQTTNPEAEETIKDAHIKAGENIKFIVVILNLEAKMGLWTSLNHDSTDDNYV